MRNLRVLWCEVIFSVNREPFIFKLINLRAPNRVRSL